MLNLRFRQIHLDFHTSEKIASVGEDFNAQEFAQTLKKAHVNSITCFAKGHHGQLYYNSKAFPWLIHPGLKNKNLLKEQIEACHEQDIRVPVYTTVQWDHDASTKHPEWLCLTADGSIVDFCREPLDSMYKPGFYRTLCVNSPYRDYLKAQIADVFDVIGAENIDGIFLDIVNLVDCSCKHCVDGMVKEGYDPTIKADRLSYAREVQKDFKKDMSAFIRSFKADASIFYNSSHINHLAEESQSDYSHFELESLPSGEWGYSHFMNTIRYARTLGLDCVTHTGKFHTSWGDFHSFKNLEALQYECFRMLAYNSKCLIGDQLPPQGQLSPPVYDLIGKVYKSVEEKEPWCENAKAVVDFAVFSPECFTTVSTIESKVPNSVVGACQMFDELGYQFDIIMDKSRFEDYPLIILPDTVTLDENLRAKFEKYLGNGGKILASYKSGLNKKENAFILKSLGVKYQGLIPLYPDFIIPNDIIGSSLPPVEHVMYVRGLEVEAVDGTTELLQTKVPFFNRTWEHFCSHLYTPSSGKAGSPALFSTSNCMYFSHPIFTSYRKNHPKWMKVFVEDALKILLPQRVVQHNGPSSLLVSVNEQKEKKRYVLHALHYIPEKNCEDIYTIEDVIPLYHTKLKLYLPQKIGAVKSVPDMTDIDFTVSDDGAITIEIDIINGHKMIELLQE